MFTAYKIPGVLETLRNQLKEKQRSRHQHQNIIDKLDIEIIDLEASIKKLEK